MSDIETPQLPATRIEHVAEYTKKNGKVVPAHDRIMPVKRQQKPRKAAPQPRDYKAERARRKSKPDVGYDPAEPRNKKRGPAPGKPRFTTATHARYIYDQLDAPLALLLGMKLTVAPTQTESDYLTRAMISRSLIALNEARVFISRFTTEGVNSDDE
jgi:hypothetical protein